MTDHNKIAVLAGGCFWGMEDLFREQPGWCPPGSATSAAATRIPPTASTPATPRHSKSPTTQETDYRALLEFFFQIHDPTTKNRQGNDVGTSYRSAIFYLDDEQKQIALHTIADIEDSGQ